MKSPVTMTTYDPRYKSAFRSLNLEWIEKYFRVETKDLEQVDHPEDCVNGGGEIFFAIQNDEAVGVCAMYKVSPGRYELAKMAVRPSAQGQGLGDLLMAAAEDWARRQGAREILMLSNTILEPAINLYRKHGYRIVHLGPHPDYERCNIELAKTL